jgi:hypothetical protein
MLTENGPQISKIEMLIREMVVFLKSNLGCTEVKIIKEKYMPEYGVQVIFQDPDVGEVTVSVFSKLEGEDLDEFVITAVTRLPLEPRTEPRYGKMIIDKMVEFLKTKKDQLKFVRAVQVARSGGFWEKCNFTALGNVTKDYELKDFKI